MWSGTPLLPVPLLRRSAVVLVTAALLGGLLAVPAVAGTANAPGPELLGELAAQIAARASGQPVEATASRTERAQVFANPDGSYTQTQFVVPVRVRRGADWVPVDTDLGVRSDGSVAPAATPLDLSFSAGGNDPLVRMRDGGRELALRWPGRLPTPELSGDTATYREVLAGVDLILRAQVTGFSQLLVVKDTRAAANPTLARLRLLTETRELSVRTGADGTLTAVDPAGEATFHAPAPYMWDSSGEQAGSAATQHAGATRAVNGDGALAPGGRVRQMGVSLAAGELTLLPDQELLTSPDTRYPVYLDPSWSGAQTAWTQVWSNYPTTSFYNGANLGSSENVARVGYDATDGKQTRSFFRFDTSGVKGKSIIKAVLQTYETWSRSCTTREVQVWETGGISSATTWKAQPTWITQLDAKSVAKGFSTSCPAGGVEFNVTAHVAKAAKSSASSITEGLRASATAESNKDTLSWKKFRNNPSITITYNTAPDAPTNLTTDGSATCVTGAGRLMLGTPTPTLRATVSDADNSVMAHFQWWTSTGSVPVGEYTSPSVAGKTPTVVSVKIPSGAFSNGVIAKWRVRAADGTDNSAWSAWCEFQVDTTRPPIPTVTSSGFPDNGEGNATMGANLSVTFGANGGSEVASYEYALNGDATVLDKKATPSVTGGSSTVTIVPDRFVNWLHVRSVTRAGNRSEVATVVFYAKPAAGPVADWAMDETGDGTLAEDSSGANRHAILGGGASWGEGVTGGALHLDGRTGYAATVAPVLDTMKSFSVAAWVRLDDKSRNSVALVQAGSRASAMALYYSTSYDRWVFNRTSADSDTPTFYRAISSTVPATGVWTHLIGVYDAAAQQVRLYVNGALEGQATFTTPWSATGGFQIGRSRLTSTYTEYWPGAIDAVQVHSRALLPGEIQQVPRLEGRWKLDETSGTIAADTRGRAPATWSATGVSRTAGISGNGVQLDGIAGVLSTANPVLRTDASYTVSVWVRPSALTKNGIAVSQDGTAVGGFNLGYSWDDQSASYRWSIRTQATDATTAALREALDPFDTPTVGTWTQLTGVYDARERVLRLYVDGQIVDETYSSSAWNATGPLRIGRGRAGVAQLQYWTGAIDEVRVYAGVLSDQEIWSLYTESAG